MSELVIRMFSKIPFLQYRFKTSATPLPLETKIYEMVEREELVQYHEIVQRKTLNIEDFLNIEIDIDISNEELEEELRKK